MTHYLRRNGKTIVDVEATKDDLSSVVCIEQYSLLLLDEQGDQTFEIIQDFDALQELRGEYHETNYQKESSNQLAERRLREIATKYDLAYVTD